MPANVPEAPGDLTPEAQAEWDRICGCLGPAGVLTQVDRGVLAAYCEIWSDLQEVGRLCRKDGKLQPFVKTVAGNVVQNPAIGLRNSLRKQLKDYAGCLGLTPADRSRVSKAASSEDDKLQAALERFRKPSRKRA